METQIACEICEELWSPRSPHIDFYLSGVEIISNGSGSHHELRKLNSRIDLMKNATRRCGGVYLYSNHQGCDGNRLYFDGASLVTVNGNLVAQGSQFSMTDVEVVTATIDLETVRSYRMNSAIYQEQASRTREFAKIQLLDFSIRATNNNAISENKLVATRIHLPQEECCKGPACWLWDYLRRSGASGFLLPLSGGADSSSVASIVRVMCEMVGKAVFEEKNQQVTIDCKRILGEKDFEASTSATDLANHLCNSILHTIYMGTVNSSDKTRDRAKRLSASIHSYHSSIVFDTVFNAMLSLFRMIHPEQRIPQFESEGGSITEDLALQNLQARLRMVIAYLCAQLFPWMRGKRGFLLVLGSANVDEALRGYMTKYDCSSADINPIGGICKMDLKAMMLYIAEEYKIPILNEIVAAPPTVRQFVHLIVSVYYFCFWFLDVLCSFSSLPNISPLFHA
jgi:NAD+ synthase (glutamine-hydrolysing)